MRQAALAGKDRVVDRIGWVDMGVVTELRKGFDFVGHARHAGVFAQEPRPPKLSKGESAQLDERHGKGWLPTHRPGVAQTSAAGRKLRPVDDFTENKVNLAFGSMDKLDLNALDELICICRIWTRAMCDGPAFELVLSSGHVLKGSVHPGWKKVGCEPLLTTLCPGHQRGRENSVVVS
ncbi:unnamed protein product [Symbiodinium natans]|uniref:Uncharacterized protein n=1 Tax=Symbiodinium natans TaxID=878477 RepID=A0A812K8N6_9DINO|nr:unnamed protein product [Symbiodinium natans]